MTTTYKPYPEYKDSGIEWLGKIPAHWIISSLRWHISIASGEFLSGDFVDKNKDYVSKFKVIGGNGILGYSSRINTELPVFAIGRVGALCGNVYFLKEKCWITDNALKVSSWNNIHEYYFLYTLQAARINQYASTTAQPLITGEQIKSLRITIPLQEEQKQIADFLDHETAKIDTLIDKQQQLIKLLKEKRQAVISHAVTKGLNPDVPMKDSGVEWLGEVPEHWKVTRLKYHVTLFEQGWSPQCDTRPAEDGEYGVLKVGCVNYGVFNASENKALPTELQPLTQYTLSKGDLLISRANTKELVGSAAVVDHDYEQLLLCDKLYRIRFDEAVCPALIAYFLAIPIVRQQIELEASGASHSMQNIGQSTIKELFIALPPIDEALQLVTGIRTKIKTFDSTLYKSNHQIGLLQERRAALISAAVTGKIDVRGWQAEQRPSPQPLSQR